MAGNAACAICQEDFSEDPASPTRFMACGHKYHQVCIDTLCNASMLDEDQLRCPLCQNSASEIREKADALLTASEIREEADALLGDVVQAEEDGALRPESPSRALGDEVLAILDRATQQAAIENASSETLPDEEAGSEDADGQPEFEPERPPGAAARV